MTAKRPRKKQTPPATGAPPVVTGITWASQTKKRDLEWAVSGLIPLYTATVIEGRKGTGKSTLLASLIAAWTGGPAIPGWIGGARGRVLVVATEDPWDAIVYPRIEAAAGNLDRVGKLEVQVEGYPPRWPHIPTEIGWIEETMNKAGADLLILDPFDDLASDGYDLDKREPAGLFMGAITTMCERSRVTALLSRNLRKDSSGDILNHGSGSGKLGNRARSLVRCDFHPHDPKLRIVGAIAGNWLQNPAKHFYRVIDMCGGIGAVEWAGNCDLDMDAVAEGRGSAAERDEWAECDRILCAVIGARWTELEVIRREAAAGMITERMLRRAKERLKLTWRRVNFAGPGSIQWGPPPSGWPDALTKSVQGGGHPVDGGVLGALGPRSAAQPDLTPPKEPRAPRTPPPLAPPLILPEFGHVEPEKAPS